MLLETQPASKALAPNVVLETSWKNFFVITGWVFMATAACYTGVGALEYATGPVRYFDIAFREKYLSHLGTVWIHSFSAVLALMLGPLQFVPRLSPRTHRMVGWAYLICVTLGGLTGFKMSLMAFGGVVSQLGFLGFSVAWLATAYLSVRAILQKRFNDHRAWSIRCYALTFSAITIRLMLYWLQYLGFALDTIYPTTAWLSWLGTLFIVELVFLRKERRES